MAKKIKDWLNNIVTNLKQLLDNTKANSPAAKIIEKNYNAFKEVQKQWNAALISATENFNNVSEDYKSGSEVKYSLRPYSQHQKDNWKNSKSIIVYENEQQFEQFIDDAINNKNLNKKLYFGSISNELGKTILKGTRLDVTGYNCTLRASEIKKIFSDHGNEKTENLRGQRAITKEDIKMIPKILSSPDDVTLDKKLYQGKPVIKFIKTINGKMTVSAYVSKKHLDLTVQTMYSGKNKKGNLATAADEQASANTPEANAGTVTSNNSILKSNENVKIDEKNSLRDNEYMSAVESGDTETAQRLVDEAAKEWGALTNSAGNPLRLYHGTTAKFTSFNRKFSNIEGDWGKGFYFTNNITDVETNYASEESPDLKIKIERYAERLEYDDRYSELNDEDRMKIARDKFITAEPNTIEGFIKMANPAKLGENETFFDYNEEYDEETDDYGEPVGTLIDFVDALEEVSTDYAYRDIDFWSIFGDDIYNGGISLSDAVSKLKETLIDDLIDDSGDVATNEVIRLALEQMGYDGIIDTTVSKKFKTMNGMNSATIHYIVFNPNQIKSADAITYDDNGNVIPLSERFNEDKDDIRYSLRDDIDEQIKSVLNNTHDRYNHVYMGNTPQTLVNILGFHKLPMLLTNNHAYSMTVSEKQAKADNRYKKDAHYHNLGIDRMKRLPKKLNKPVMIVKSNTDSNNLDVVVVTDMLDDNNRPVIVAIKPYGKGNYYNVELDTNIIKSGYGRDDFYNYINRASKENRILFVDKKSSQRLNTKWVQFPNNIESIDYNNSLSQYKTLVNSYYMQNNKNSLRDNEIFDREQIEDIIKEQFGSFSRTKAFKDNVLSDMAEKLDVAYTMMTDRSTADNGKAKLKSIAREIYDKTPDSVKKGDNYIALRDEIQSYGIKITDEIKSELGDDYNNFLHKNMNRLNMRFANKGSLDEAYEDLSVKGMLSGEAQALKHSNETLLSFKNRLTTIKLKIIKTPPKTAMSILR